MVTILKEYMKCGVLGSALAKAGVKTSQHKMWLDDYPKYAEQFHIVKSRFIDGIERVGIEKAMNGSDGMIQFMLKAHRREVYGDRTDVNLSGQTDNRIQLVFAEGMLSPEEKKLLGGGDDGVIEVETVQSDTETSDI